MDAKELRIDDYFIPITENGGELTARKIKASEFLYLFENPEKAKPVVLTEEILIKAGFALLNFDSYEHDGYKILSLKCGNIRLFADSTNNYSTVENSTIGVKIFVLHKLQNFYFEMADKELEINL